jgi:hypothetical protein
LNAAELLWSRHHPPDGYPPGVLAVPKPIPGIGFFPGGYGLWRPDTADPLPAFPVSGIMVLGHDFHSESGYRASLRRGRESPTQPTRRVLLGLLARAAVDPSRCFFTNVYMGLRKCEATTGPFPGASDDDFVDHCVDFLDAQIAAQQPRHILTLGVNVPPLLARLSAELTDWTAGRGLKYLDQVGPVRTRVRVGVTSPVEATVVALTHPSMRHASVRHRRYRGDSGDAAEVRMLADALGPGISTR